MTGLHSKKSPLHKVVNMCETSGVVKKACCECGAAMNEDELAGVENEYCTTCQDKFQQVIGQEWHPILARQTG